MEKMKAWVLHGINEICLETVERPLPAKGEVLVAVKAAGICGSDVPRIYKTGAHIHPLVPGHEFSGVVEAVGEGVNDSWLRKRVGVFPLIPCGNCMPCRKKQYEMCRNYDYLGSRRNGGFGEYVTVPETNLIELPDRVSFQEAAMLEPMAVAAHAIRRAMPEAGCENRRGAEKDKMSEYTVAVCGLGTIGLLLVMLLLEQNTSSESKILVIGNKDFQKERIVEMGISDESYCDSRHQNVREWLMKQTQGSGVDVFFECVGKSETFSQAVDNTAPGGRICLVGNPDTDMLLEKAVYWKLLRNQLTVTGTWNSSFACEPGSGEMDRKEGSIKETETKIGETECRERAAGGAGDDWAYVLEKLSQKRILPEKLISHRLSFADLERGLHIMRDKLEDYVKIMIVLCL